MIQFLSKNYNKKYWKEMGELFEYTLSYAIHNQMSSATKKDLVKAYDYILNKLNEGEEENAGRI